MPLSEPTPRFFETPAELHHWYSQNHDKLDEFWIGFHRRDSGLASIDYREALEEALCWGWIDGIRIRRDETSYVQRFTPRRPRSIWSKVNQAHVERLRIEGRMQPAGIAAFERRTPARSGVYSFEQERPVELSPEHQRTFRRESAAWAFHSRQPAYYRKVTAFWVESAKKPETRQRRLAKLIRHAAAGERLPEVSSPTQRRSAD